MLIYCQAMVLLWHWHIYGIDMYFKVHKVHKVHKGLLLSFLCITAELNVSLLRLILAHSK